MNKTRWMVLRGLVMSGVLVTASMASTGDGGEMLLELLGTVGQGMADNDKFKDCLGDNARANGARCFRESQERQNRYSEQVQRRTSEREQRERLKEEREAMAACEREQDPDRYARCVRSRLP